MFRNHNIFSVAAGTLILLNCAIEFYSLASVNTILHMDFDFNFYRAVVILLLMICSLLGAAAIFFKRIFALKLCFLIYVVQILGFIYGETYYILSYGLWISWSTEIADLSVEISLVAMFISAVIFMAMRSLEKNTDLDGHPS
jgi:hypothetical protein